jgi:hypothetical protein
MSGRGVIVRYRDKDGTWVFAGEVQYPKLLIARHQPVLDVHDVTVVLEWHQDSVSSMLAPNREAAEMLIAMFGLK